MSGNFPFFPDRGGFLSSVKVRAWLHASPTLHSRVYYSASDTFRGYSFAPRYAQAGRIINEMFVVAEDEAGKINLSLRTPINAKCIARHWDKIQRIVVSLKERKTTQALLIRKLSTYKKGSAK